MKLSRAFIQCLLIAGVLLSGVPMMVAQQSNSAATQTPIAHALEENDPPQSDNYPLGPDSKPQASAPAGKTFKFDMIDSKIFPGTTRTITVYIPAAYAADKPACVYVGLDGLGFNASVVFDNLIAQHAMPVTLGIGVSAGTVTSANASDNPRFDRSFELDSLNDRLARFLIDEVIPEVQKHKTPDGKAIILSANPNDRAIGGGSTGAIGAFTVAWQRPDAFRRVFSAIGTYVGMRGGEQYNVLVRKTEPKPIRIFMQDGAHDEWPGGPEMGDWWMSNLTMNRALEFAGYDARHVWGTGTHNGNQAAAVFPDAMRWLWRDWSAPITARQPGNPVLQAILQPGSDWEIAAYGCSQVTTLASDSQGDVFYQGSANAKIPQSPTTAQPAWCNEGRDSSAFAFGPDGKLYVVSAEGGLAVRANPGAHEQPISDAASLHIQSLTVRNNGDIYAAAEGTNGKSELWLISASGKKIRVDEGLKGASGAALTPDGLWLFVTQQYSQAGLSYRVKPDGTLDAREPFYFFDVPNGADDSGATQIAMDRDGRAYVATRMGIQVFDRNGRVTAILPLPNHEAATGVCFGGPDFDMLYVAAGAKIYRRKLHIVGAPPWAAPVKLPPWGAG